MLGEKKNKRHMGWDVWPRVSTGVLLALITALFFTKYEKGGEEGMKERREGNDSYDSSTSLDEARREQGVLRGAPGTGGGR